MLRKLLIVTTTFHPHPVVGAVRVTQFARHLPEFGWVPIVCCRYYGASASAEQRAREVHPEVDLHYVGRKPPTPSPAGDSCPRVRDVPPSAASLRWKERIYDAVGSFAVPDLSLPFWRSVRPELARIVMETRPDALLTSSPPHSNHDVGLWLARERPELPWIADFRDPYLIDNRYGPRGAGRVVAHLHARWERRIYESASCVLHAIPTQYRWARRRYRAERDKLYLLTNGCPADLIEGRIQAAERGPGPRVCTMGKAAVRERIQIGRAVERLWESFPDLELRHIGHRERADDELDRLLGKGFRCTGALSHAAAMREMLAADVLVSVVGQADASVGGLSSKLYEFLVCGKPILSINPCNADRHLLARSEGVRVLRRPDEAELAAALAWALGPGARPPESQVAEAKRRFSRRTQTERLATILDQLVGATAGTS